MRKLGKSISVDSKLSFVKKLRKNGQRNSECGYSEKSSSNDEHLFNEDDQKKLESVEDEMFKVVHTPINRFYVHLSDKTKIWTLSANTSSTNTPIVIVHGFCGGIGFWINNVDCLAEKNPFYAFDLLGYSRSSRPEFSEDASKAEEQFLNSIDEWRRKLNIDQMILLGHSFGGFLATAFAIKYPDSVRALVLIDPWGFNDNPRINKPDESRALWVKAVNRLQSRLGPLDLVRVSGPVGLTMFRIVRPNYRHYFDKILPDPNIVYNYIYYANLPNPTGEVAFKNMSEMLFYAKNPVIRKVEKIESRIPIWFIYGKRSFIDSSPSLEVQKIRKNCAPVTIKKIKGADHHVYAIKAKEFNEYIRGVLDEINSKY